MEDDDDNAYVISLDMRKLEMPLVRKLGLTVNIFNVLCVLAKKVKRLVKVMILEARVRSYNVSDRCRAKCDVLLNNLCEVFNRQLVDGRDVPIITCLQFVREYLMKRIINVKKVISKSKGPLTPAATKLFDAIKYKASFYTVNMFSH
ncbi:hypothetical protein Tco_0268190 [Tanacetum coccineum]